MEWLKKWGQSALIGAAFLLFFVGVIRAIAANPADADVPRAKDLQAVSRVAFELADTAAAQTTGKGDFVQPMTPKGFVAAQGIVEPADREVKVGSQLPGLIKKVYVKEGQDVKAGTPLVELDDDVEAASLDAAKARAALSDANLARVQKLSKSGASTGDELDRATFQAEIDRASVHQAKAQLERLTIKAPSNGTILQLIVREGEYYNPAAGALLTMGDLAKVRVRLDVDERDVTRVYLGQPGYVLTEGTLEKKYPGHVVDIARRMGRKNIRTDEPTERIDTIIREVVVELDDGHDLVQGVRAIGYLEPKGEPKG